MPNARSTLQTQVAASFVRAVLRIGNARPIVRGEGRRRVSQRDMARATGPAKLSRSGIAKLMTDEAGANPTLNTICQIAEVLGVPPAYLLMRDVDWELLAQAIDEYEVHAKKPAVMQLAARIAQDPDHSAFNSVLHGRQIAETVLEISEPASGDPLIREPYEDRMNHIGAACAAPPLHRIHPNRPGLVPLLLTICARMGSAFRTTSF